MDPHAVPSMHVSSLCALPYLLCRWPGAQRKAQLFHALPWLQCRALVWCVMCSAWPRRMLPPSSSLMRSTPSPPLASMPRQALTGELTSTPSAFPSNATLVPKSYNCQPDCCQLQRQVGFKHHTSQACTMPSVTPQNDVSSCREVQRILMELLNQMDGFDQNVNVKVRRHTLIMPDPARSARICCSPLHALMRGKPCASMARPDCLLPC